MDAEVCLFKKCLYYRVFHPRGWVQVGSYYMLCVNKESQQVTITLAIRH